MCVNALQIAQNDENLRENITFVVTNAVMCSSYGSALH